MKYTQIGRSDRKHYSASINQEPKGETTCTDLSGVPEQMLGRDQPDAQQAPNSNRPSSAKAHPKVGRDRRAMILGGGEGRTGPRHHGMHAHCPSPRVHVHPAPPHSTHVTQRLTGETCDSGIPVSRARLHAGGAPYVVPPTLPAMNRSGRSTGSRGLR